MKFLLLFALSLFLAMGNPKATSAAIYELKLFEDLEYANLVGEGFFVTQEPLGLTGKVNVNAFYMELYGEMWSYASPLEYGFFGRGINTTPDLLLMGEVYRERPSIDEETGWASNLEGIVFADSLGDLDSYYSHLSYPYQANIPRNSWHYMTWATWSEGGVGSYFSGQIGGSYGLYTLRRLGGETIPPVPLPASILLMIPGLLFFGLLRLRGRSPVNEGSS